MDFEKTGFTDDGRLRDDSSFAVQLHKAELKQEAQGPRHSAWSLAS